MPSGPWWATKIITLAHFLHLLICFISSNLCRQPHPTSNKKDSCFTPLRPSSTHHHLHSASHHHQRRRSPGRREKKRAPEPTIPGAEERDKVRSGRAGVFVSFLFSNTLVSHQPRRCGAGGCNVNIRGDQQTRRENKPGTAA